MFANFFCGVHEFCYRISLIYKCREISIGVAVVVLCCLRKLLLLCLLNDVVVTFVGHRTSLSSPNPHPHPHPHPPRTSTHPPSSRRHFRSRKTGNTGGKYLYNNCFLRFLFTNKKTEVKLLFFVSCTKRKKPKNGSRIAFSVFFVQDQKKKRKKRK